MYYVTYYISLIIPSVMQRFSWTFVGITVSAVIPAHGITR